MTGTIVPPVGERLTPRARAYLLIACLRHGVAGLALLIFPGAFASPSFDGIKGALPLQHRHSLMAWGVVFLFTAIVCGWAAASAREGSARIALSGSIFASLVWLGGFIAATALGVQISPMGAIFCAALVAKDLTMLRDPLRNPFEPIARKVLRDQNGG